MKKYFYGYGIALILTLASFGLVTQKGSSIVLRSNMLFALLILAVIQLTTQMYFFLHIGFNRKSRLNTLALLFASLIVCIIVIGSVWIMSNLNYNMMPEGSMDTYMLNQ